MAMRAEVKLSLDQLTNILSAEILAEQIITEVTPTKKVLAKWKLSGFDASEITTKRGVLVPAEYKSAAMKSSIGTNTATIDLETSNNDSTYSSLTGFQLTSIATAGFEGARQSRVTNLITLDQAGFSEGFIRLVAWNTAASQSMTVKNIKALVLAILPAGVTVKKIL